MISGQNNIVTRLNEILEGGIHYGKKYYGIKAQKVKSVEI